MVDSPTDPVENLVYPPESSRSVGQSSQIMQELWRKKWQWDQPLAGEILKKWVDWKSSLAMLSEIRIPRCYFSREEQERETLELHHFCDASEVGYGTVSYLLSGVS